MGTHLLLLLLELLEDTWWKISGGLAWAVPEGGHVLLEGGWRTHPHIGLTLLVEYAVHFCLQFLVPITLSVLRLHFQVLQNTTVQ